MRPFDCRSGRVQAEPRSTLFTGSQAIAEQLVIDLRGKARTQKSGAAGVMRLPSNSHELNSPFRRRRSALCWTCPH
jgi:hypothetical protein